MESNCKKERLDNLLIIHNGLINTSFKKEVTNKILDFYKQSSKLKNLTENAFIEKIHHFNSLILNDNIHKKLDKNINKLAKKIKNKTPNNLYYLLLKGIKKTLIQNNKLSFYADMSDYSLRLYIFKQIKSILKTIKFFYEKDIQVSKKHLNFFSQFYNFEEKNNYLKAIILNQQSEYTFNYIKRDNSFSMSNHLFIEEKFLDISLNKELSIDLELIEEYFDKKIPFNIFITLFTKRSIQFISELEEYYSFDYQYYLDLAKNISSVSNIEIPTIRYFGKYKFSAKHDILKKIKEKCNELDELYSEIAFKNNIGKRRFDDMFPMARNKTRKFTFFIGETGAGKTYHALQKIKDKKTGLFLAPLRLLALEGQENIEEMGIPCNLITGEEQDVKEDAMFCSSTIEMLDITEEYDVIIIDEVQMLFDKDRGWAWTQAIIGGNAEEIILTGSEEALEAVKFLTDYTSDKLEIVKLNKKTKVEKYNKKVNNVSDIPEHTAVVCFSKKRILELKNLYERETGKQASVVFGALSPDTRKEEARRFREGETTVVFATDAIGLGLNLPIKHVLFDKLEKYDGENEDIITSSLAKQIVGRAGRFGYFNTGYYGMFNNNNIKLLDNLLKEDYPEHSNHFYYKVPYVVFQEISDLINSTNCFDIINKFIELYDLVEDNFIKMDYTDLIYKARIIEKNLYHAPDKNMISLYEKYKLIFSPLDVNDKDMKSFFNYMVKEKLVKLNDFDFDKELKSSVPSIKTLEDMNLIEYKLSVLDAYNWLSYNFPDIFKIPEQTIRNEKYYLNELVMFFLKEDGELFKQCAKCKTHIKLTKYNYCNNCFQKKKKEYKKRR